MCVCSLKFSSMQSACVVLYCHLWPVRLFHISPHRLINRTTFGKKFLSIKCVFYISLQHRNISHRQTNWPRHCHKGTKLRLHIKFPLFLSYFNQTWIFVSKQVFKKKTQISNFEKNRPVAAQLFGADRRTDMTKLIAGFFYVEYIYGFVGWGGLHAKSMTSQRYRATYKMADMHYYGNVMTTTRWRLYVILHLQQYSRRLDLFCFFAILATPLYKKCIEFRRDAEYCDSGYCACGEIILK